MIIVPFCIAMAFTYRVSVDQLIFRPRSIPMKSHHCQSSDLPSSDASEVIRSPREQSQNLLLLINLYVFEKRCIRVRNPEASCQR